MLGSIITEAVHAIIDQLLEVGGHHVADGGVAVSVEIRDDTLETMLRDIGRADLIILDEFGYVPSDIDGARLPWPDHRGQLRKTEHHLRHEHRVR